MALVPVVLDAAGRHGLSATAVLAALARVIDARGPTVSPTELVLPRLDELVGAEAGAASGDADAYDIVATALGAADAGPELLGQVHEALLDGAHRRRRGVFYTPIEVAAGLVGEVLGRHDAAGTPTVTVCDPASGGGVFLLAAAEALVARGVTPAAVVHECVWGIDVDPLAVAVAEAALIVWARARGVDTVRTNVACADTLLVGSAAWPDPPAGFDVVVGNPPFQNQLGAGTARSAADAERLRERWGAAVYRYTDSAALFLLAGLGLASPTGRVCLIVPVPVLVTADADRVRRDLLDHATIEHLWIAEDDVFEAGVRVCAPVLRAGTDSRGSATATAPARLRVTRSSGRSFRPIDAREVEVAELRASSTWAVLMADAFGVPVVAATAPASGRLGDFCTATAGFRDQYYGLRPFVVEQHDGAPDVLAEGPDGPARADRPAGEGRAGPRWPRLMTSGLIDPARSLWGSRSTRFDGRSWLEPVIDLDRLERDDQALAAWTAPRLVPKVVVATQTRVLEAAVDVEGTWFPSVPTIALTPGPDRIWDAAAVVLAPSTTVWAMNRHAGAALSADALKVSARQLLEAPLPSDEAAWRRGVERLRAASAALDAASWRTELERFGEEMALAYAAPDEVLAWWRDRLPRWR